MATENLNRIYDINQYNAVKILCKPIKKIFAGTNLTRKKIDFLR
jgi:hypothetical protein